LNCTKKRKQEHAFTLINVIISKNAHNTLLLRMLRFGSTSLKHQAAAAHRSTMTPTFKHGINSGSFDRNNEKKNLGIKDQFDCKFREA
jgi:hypothetical protein